MNMDKQRRKELQELAKQIKTEMGIIQITNKITGKIFIDTSRNLKNRWLTIKMQLDLGRFYNLALQKDWTEMGEDAFSYEILEKKEVDEETGNQNEALKKMLKPWLNKKQPYEEKGYNRRKEEV